MMKIGRLSSVVGCLVLGIGFNGLGFVQEVRATSPANSTDSTVSSQSSLSLPPIAPNCAFPPLPLSQSASDALFGEVKLESGDVRVGTPFTPGDGSDSDLASNIVDLVAVGKLEQALEVARHIEDSFQKNVALFAVARAYQQTGQLDRAFEVVQTIKEPDNFNLFEQRISNKDSALSEIADAYTEAGELEQALKVVEVVSNPAQVPLLLNIAQKYVESGKRERAIAIISDAYEIYQRAIASRLGTEDPDILATETVFNQLQFAAYYASAGQTEKALEILPEVVATAENLPPNYLVLTYLSGTAILYATLGEEDRAANVLASLYQIAKNVEREPLTQTLVLTQIAKVYNLLAQPNRATEILAEAFALADLEQNATDKNALLISIAHSYGLLGNYEQAFQSIEAVEPDALRDRIRQTLTCSRQNSR